MPRLAVRSLNALLRLFVQRQLRRGLTVDTIRVASAALERWAPRTAPVPAEDQVAANGVACAWLGPRVAPEGRIVLYLHGGGLVSHLPSVYRGFARRLSRLLGARVLLPDYRLAPEHRFPAGPDDCLAVYRWLLAEGFNSRRIVIAGDSAGGNLALVTAIRIRDEALAAPGCVVMMSPVTDFTCTGASFIYNRELDPFLVPELQQVLLSAYAPGVSADHPWIWPLYDSLERLPPLLFHAGSVELIADDSKRAAERARRAGGIVEVEIWRDLPHVFQMLPSLRESREALVKIARFVREHVPMPIPQSTPKRSSSTASGKPTVQV